MGMLFVVSVTNSFFHTLWRHSLSTDWGPLNAEWLVVCLMRARGFESAAPKHAVIKHADSLFTLIEAPTGFELSYFLLHMKVDQSKKSQGRHRSSHLILYVLYTVFSCCLCCKPSTIAKNRWLTPFTLPDDEFASFFSGVSCSMLEAGRKTGNSRKQHGGQR